VSVGRTRPGDRRVRVARTRPEEVKLKPLRRPREPLSPAKTLVIGFLILIATGTGLLLLPLSTADGQSTDLITALFTATSAACVTGLVVVDTATHWSAFGEVVILLLIQAGGFGIMTGSTLLLYVIAGRRTRLHDRVAVDCLHGRA
jgi:trk system potassium uptake protein TrkH